MDVRPGEKYMLIEETKREEHRKRAIKCEEKNRNREDKLILNECMREVDTRIHLHVLSSSRERQKRSMWMGK